MSELKMRDYFFNGGIDSDDDGCLIENGFKIARGMCKYKASAISHAVSSHDSLIKENQRLTEIATKHATRADELHVALEKIMPAVKQYLEYEHNGDPYTEDARSMGEMDLNELDNKGFIEEVFSIIENSRIEAVINSNDY